MDLQNIIDKITANNTALDAKLAAKDAEIATLTANAVDPAQVQTISDALDTQAAKLV